MVFVILFLGGGGGQRTILGSAAELPHTLPRGYLPGFKTKPPSKPQTLKCNDDWGTTFCRLPSEQKKIVGV